MLQIGGSKKHVQNEDAFRGKKLLKSVFSLILSEDFVQIATGFLFCNRSLIVSAPKRPFPCLIFVSAELEAQRRECAAVPSAGRIARRSRAQRDAFGAAVRIHRGLSRPFFFAPQARRCAPPTGGSEAKLRCRSI
ncbi:MAG: hypothetical protein IJU56_02905 [Clostridia bacterium]|nr:hypothetical protein [Clostridia bacterium]